MQENQRLAFAHINFLSDQMAWSAGVQAGPHIEVPMPTYIENAPFTMNTTNNIRVDSGSQVGQINAGALVYLDKAVSNFNAAGGQDLASALQSFTQAAIDNKQLGEEKQREILNLLRELVEQVKKPKVERNPTVARIALTNIGVIVNAITALATHWSSLKAFFEHLLT
jgi:hypothetical protein